MPTPFITVLDDLSEETSKTFDTLGRQMMDEFGDRIVAALQPRLDELRDNTQWDRKENQFGRLDSALNVA